ncbi:unnamed protein product [Vicia faba]|uniref:Uncharacterized protein n=1 Tax=Vicia faba TaxID=3906 RepID=A0AAV0ZG85_VICFA|nr:unnamed protein product [Vicia faba]
MVNIFLGFRVNIAILEIPWLESSSSLKPNRRRTYSIHHLFSRTPSSNIVPLVQNCSLANKSQFMKACKNDELLQHSPKYMIRLQNGLIYVYGLFDYVQGLKMAIMFSLLEASIPITPEEEHYPVLSVSVSRNLIQVPYLTLKRNNYHLLPMPNFFLYVIFGVI